MNNELTNWTRRQHSFCWSNAVPYFTMQVSYYQNAKAHPKVLKRISKHADQCRLKMPKKGDRKRKIATRALNYTQLLFVIEFFLLKSLIS